MSQKQAGESREDGGLKKVNRALGVCHSMIQLRNPGDKNCNYSDLYTTLEALRENAKTFRIDLQRFRAQGLGQRVRD